MTSVLTQNSLFEGHTRTVAPTQLAVPVMHLRDHVYAGDSDRDDYLERLIKAATRHVEQYTNRALVTQTWRLSLRDFPEVIHVPRPPLIAVTSVAYTDTDGASQTLTENTDFLVNTDYQPGRLTEAYNQTWPAVRDVARAVQITHAAGYGTDWEAVPEDFRHGILMLAAHWFRNRETVVVGTISSEIALALSRLLEHYVIETYG